MNEYLAEYLKVKRSGDSHVRYEERKRLVGKYSWAIPNQEALEAIASLKKPVVEIGAGLGYWAHLLSANGVDIVAYDINPVEDSWFGVALGDCSVVTEYPDRALMLCWPPYDKTMATDCLSNYTGDCVIYIGEGPGGCTADDAFHEELTNSWERVLEVNIPQWDGIHDYMTLWRRAS